MVKTSQCNRGCGALIYFDNEQRSQSGKMIPMEVNTSQPHQCPKSTWNKSGGEGRQQQVTATQPVVQANTNSMLMDMMKEIRDALLVSPRTADNMESKSHADHVNLASMANEQVLIKNELKDIHQLIDVLLKEQGLFQGANELQQEVTEGEL